MANQKDSNQVTTRYALEDDNDPGVLSTPVVWYPTEPNSFGDSGATIKRTPREPITGDRNRRKGKVTGLDAMFGMNIDLTRDNCDDFLSSFFFADWRAKDSQAVTAVTGTAFTVADESDFAANDLIVALFHGTAGNNGLFVVTGTAAGAVQASGLTAEASPPSKAIIRKVGVVAGAADIDVDASGAYPVLTSTLLDFTALPISVGEWIYLGGDAAGTHFVEDDADGNLVNTGFARIRSIAANALELDKTQYTMATETGTGISLRIFFGDLLYNELAKPQIKKKPLQFERKLDDGGYEYTSGCVANTLSIALAPENKVALDMSFVGLDSEYQSGAASGTRPDLDSQEVFTTAEDFGRLRVLYADDLTGALDFMQEITLDINNGVNPTKALGTLGSIDLAAGNFAVSGRISGLFTSTALMAAIRAGTSLTLDVIHVYENAGILFEVLQLELSEGKPTIEADKPIVLPLSFEASKDETLNRTMTCQKFWYLPDRAEQNT